MNTEAFITELSNTPRRARRIGYRRIMAELALVVLVSFALVTTLWQGMRPDLLARLSEPLFLAEILLNIVLVALAGVAAISSAFPDRAHAPLLKLGLVGVFLGYSVLTLITALRIPEFVDSLANTAPHGLECLICILSFALVPSVWIIWRIRQLATVTPAFTAGAALMMAVALGCLGVRLLETEIFPTGLIVWHYLPLLLLSLVGFLLGKKILRW